MKTVITKSGHKILVDDEDFERLSKYTWHVSSTNANNLYAMRHVRINGKKTKRYLHREVLNNPEGAIIDHIDQNGLNCQRSNLRISNKSQNCQNRRPYGQVPYLGVSKHNDKFRVQIYHNGKRYSKVCSTAEKAALMYNELAVKFYGESATLNKVM